MISVCDRLENIVGKGENAGYHIFSFSLNVFRSFPVLGHANLDCLVKG